MRGKIYTITDLNQALPLIRAVVSDIMRRHGALCDDLVRLGIARTDPPSVETIVYRDLPWKTRDLVDELREFVDELGELGIFLLDPRRGLVKAYGERDGEIVYYTWMFGEERVSFWHGLFGSHRERKPVCAPV